MPSETESRPHAFITGASSGIGAAFAERLAREGYDLLLVARRRDRLESLAARLEQDHGARVEPLVADLGNSADLHGLEERLAADEALDLLVNNAGYGGYMPFIQLDPDRAEDLVNVQVVSVVRLTRAALPGMLARRRGTVVNVASRLGFTGSLGSSHLPKRAVYAGTKSFVITFTQLVQSELEGTGVQMQVLCPGVVATEFHERVGLPPNAYPPAIVMQPEDVVTASLAGLRLGEVVCIPPLEDPDRLRRLQQDEREFFEASTTGKLASRYTAPVSDPGTPGTRAPGRM